MAAAVAMALVASLLHSLINYAVFLMFFPRYYQSGFEWMQYIAAMLQWFWSYAAISGMLFALHSSFDVEDRERQIGQLQRIAHQAQLRALRYQLNPHFMFNTLNSIAALISRRKTREAEAMVENLADFLRAGLSLDPLEDIPLSREVELQSLYLAIETVRFVDRLRVTIDVSDAAAGALVPSLVTQPLVENVVRHAVVDTAAATDLAITALREGDALVVSVVNTVPGHERHIGRGTGVGLANVEARLRARFDHVAFSAGIRQDGRYEVRFAVPYQREAAA
ncbi:MAG: histidine kinase [Sphingomonas sp.]